MFHEPRRRRHHLNLLHFQPQTQRRRLLFQGDESGPVAERRDANTSEILVIFLHFTFYLLLRVRVTDLLFSAVTGYVTVLTSSTDYHSTLSQVFDLCFDRADASQFV